MHVDKTVAIDNTSNALSRIKNRVVTAIETKNTL